LSSARPAGNFWDSQSREFTLTCDAQGKVQSLDSRCERRLKLQPGSSFFELAPPGMRSHADEVLARALREPQSNVELSLLANGGVVTCSFQMRPDGNGGVMMLGSWLPEDFGASLRQVAESVSELSNLNRQIVRQNREIAEQKQALEKTVAELDDSNKGITSLHLELQDKAEVLQRTAEVRSRVVANVSHEFRTPLHTILGLSRLLMDGSDGLLTPEQAKQVQFIRTSAEELTALVDDMLDLSSAEAGKTLLRPERFAVKDFFAALRGTLRPLLKNPEQVELRFIEPPDDLMLETDQSKLGQIMRNLISNALKFTERGFVEVSTELRQDDVIFNVRDTGIGISPDDFDRIFEEFGQVRNHLQGQVKGSGLGLALSRRMAELLDGVLNVESEPGVGSTFSVRIPKVHSEVRELSEIEARPLDPSRSPILVVEDDRKTIFIYEKYLAMTGFQVIPARTVADAERLLGQVKPAAIVLDIMLDGESSWGFLQRLKSNPDTHDVPVLVVTVTNKEQKARALGADEFWLKPVDQDRLLRKLRSLRAGSSPRVLIIDDDKRARYLVSKFLQNGPYSLIEAATGEEGITAAREHRPHVILLDFLLQETNAFDVLDELKSDPLTRDIPVIIITSHNLDPQDRERLARQSEVILSKESLSRELAINRIRDALRKAGVGGSVAMGS
jgi:signal transduction histidine kinase/CheY-like chemotaxis protein